MSPARSIRVAVLSLLLAAPVAAQVEDSLGYKAYSQLASYGVSISILKDGRLLQVVFATGKSGTAEQLALVRVMAKKAAAAY